MTVASFGAVPAMNAIGAQLGQLGHIRGVPAAVDQDSEGGHITLYTRRTTITIDAPTVGQAMQIALTLRDVNAADPSHYRLPPISARTLHGKSLCRRSR